MTQELNDDVSTLPPFLCFFLCCRKLGIGVHSLLPIFHLLPKISNTTRSPSWGLGNRFAFLALINGNLPIPRLFTVFSPEVELLFVTGPVDASCSSLSWSSTRSISIPVSDLLPDIDKLRSWKKEFAFSNQEMEDIEKAISKLEGLIRCTDLDEVQKLIRKRKRKSGKESLNSEGMPPIYQLNEETKALVKKVKNLSLRGIFPEGIALDACKDKIGIILPTSKLAGETTAQRNKESILGMINGAVRKIGVYGMGGIGKTTVMKHINNDILEEENKKFDHVIWVTVSRESSVFKLQDVISRKLGLDLSTDEDPITRAGVLFEKLKTKGRYLLILDDLWEEYPLEEVGIPDPDSDNGCKLVLTTRSLDVCQSMKCEAIKMNLLSKDEAWSLFLDHVGHDVLNVKDLEPIVRGVASECARLPLAISTIGRSMRGKKEACEWRVALVKLRAFSKDSSDKGKRVIEQLKFSYDRLENKKLQQCLFYCALYPEDYEIERRDLVELLALEGIIEEKECKRDEIDEGNAMLNHLINQCLLEGGKTGGVSWVKMHDLTRVMALQIDCLHSQYLTISGAELKSGDVKWSRDLLRIHISNCYSLNASSICSKLTTFILRVCFLSKIPDSFFLNFKSLKVLNLYFCPDLVELPNAISDMVNLVGLLLRDSPKLRYVPSLARLKDLRSLEFCMSIGRFFWQIKTYPTKVLEGLEQLSNLRYLNLISFRIKVFPYGIIPRLFNLRYLICNPFTKVSVDELMGLKNLEIFKGGFRDIHDLRVYVNYREQHRSRLTSYIFLVGSTPGYPSFIIDAYRFNSFDKVVKLSNCNLDKTQGENDLSLLPKDVQELEIDNVPDLTSLCALPSLNYATDLRKCTISQCNGVRELVTASSSAFALLSLEKLEVGHLENLEALIGRKKAPCIVFSCLQELRIYGCAKIKVLFNVGLLSNLKNLEELIVHHCTELVEIIGESMNDDNGVNEARTAIILPKLRCLRFMKLPTLKFVCPASTRLICESLKEMNIGDCPKLEQCVYAALEDNGQSSPGPSLQPIELKLVNMRFKYELFN